MKQGDTGDDERNDACNHAGGRCVGVAACHFTGGIEREQVCRYNGLTAEGDHIVFGDSQNEAEQPEGNDGCPALLPDEVEGREDEGQHEEVRADERSIHSEGVRVPREFDENVTEHDG